MQTLHAFIAHYTFSHDQCWRSFESAKFRPLKICLRNCLKLGHCLSHLSPIAKHLINQGRPGDDHGVGQSFSLLARKAQQQILGGNRCLQIVHRAST